MSHIYLKKGYCLPLQGAPLSEEITPLSEPLLCGIDFRPFLTTRCRVLVKEGQEVYKGEILARDKNCLQRGFPSPAGGVVKKILRGEKRSLLEILIERDPHKEEREVTYPPMEAKGASRENILDRLLSSGGFSPIRQRPFHLPADPQKIPKSIFVKAIESSPLQVDPAREVTHFPRFFQEGLLALQKLTEGKVHVVCEVGSPLLSLLSRESFSSRKVLCHTISDQPTAEGNRHSLLHPLGNSSVHIHHIDPICSIHDLVWTLTAHDVITIGCLLLEGRYFTDRILTLAGEGVLPEKRGFFLGRRGHSISELMAQCGLFPGKSSFPIRVISGTVFTGHTVCEERGERELSLPLQGECLGHDHSSLLAIPQPQEREFLHFFRCGREKFTLSRSYLSGMREFCSRQKKFSFTSSTHGEARAFIDSDLYDRVLPMQIATVPLVKAILAQDFERAEELGLLEVNGEDFALATFLCPSKINMVEIVQKGLQRYAEQLQS